jgi:zinc D-Ala-D-Ala carboxypeptidase
VDNVGFSDKESKAGQSKAGTGEDIPVAVREDGVSEAQPWRKQAWLIFGVVGVGAIALTVGIGLAFGNQLLPSIASLGRQRAIAPTPSAASPINTKPTGSNTLLGHFAYSEAAASDLQAISSDGRIKLRKAAAQKFQAMTAAARAQGVILVPISGFRSVSEQQQLFFEVKAQRNQRATERATVSAPPGYSEHHTGYAIDIGDGRVPATNLSPNFENTAAFKWLQANAARYSFEISFPKNNAQGVTYEPWHWRFVGDRDSLETFYKARQSGS